MNEAKDQRQPTEIHDRRLAWVRPGYTRTRAGDAEIGPNPDTVDGAFTKS
jgi:hypothetical protein